MVGACDVIRRLLTRAAALRAFAADRKGVSAVEFALVLPVMILIYIGGVEVSLALSVDRKVDSVASTVGDLVAQFEAIGGTEIDNIFNASTAVMEPNPVDDLQIVVALVGVNAQGEPRVAWSRARNATGWTANSAPPITIPADVLPAAGQQVVVARVSYEYATPFTGFMENVTGRTGYDFEHTYFLRPRASDTITGP